MINEKKNVILFQKKKKTFFITNAGYQNVGNCRRIIRDMLVTITIVQRTAIHLFRSK